VFVQRQIEEKLIMKIKNFVSIQRFLEEKSIRIIKMFCVYIKINKGKVDKNN